MHISISEGIPYEPSFDGTRSFMMHINLNHNGLTLELLVDMSPANVYPSILEEDMVTHVGRDEDALAALMCLFRDGEKGVWEFLDKVKASL